MKTDDADSLIKIQERFERDWKRYFNLIVGSVILATFVCLVSWVFSMPGFDPRLVFGVCVLTAFALIYFKGLSCPRCGYSLLVFGLNSKPKFCPQCGVSFTGFPRD